MLRFASLGFVLSFLGCADESVTGYADRNAVYRLIEIAGAEPELDADLTFPSRGAIRVETSCGLYEISTDVPYPWIAMSRAVVTPRECDARGADAIFFGEMMRVTLAEVTGPVLILTTDDGDLLVFRAE
ncbi:META domain-containing protein [Rhodobacteraceae bacterium]|nr:META domain-containing protein [Paracoccaceae bacterium]